MLYTSGLGLICFTVSLLSATAAHAQTGGAFLLGTPPHTLAHRAALVIGITPYSNLQHLPNAEPDADAINMALGSLGFNDLTLVKGTNPDTPATFTGIKHDINDLVDNVQQNHGVLVIYFAGHGVTWNGQAYILPAEADLHRPSDVESDGIPVSWVLDRIKAANADIAILIIDACRTSPFQTSSNDFQNALSEKVPDKLEVPDHTLLVYSTSQGTSAADGGPGNPNSPFAAQLLAHISQRETAPDLFNSVGMALTGMQSPRIYGGLNADFRFMMTGQDYTHENQLFEPIKQLNTASAFAYFKHQYPVGYFASVADADSRAAEESERNKLNHVWVLPTGVTSPQMTPVRTTKATQAFQQPFTFGDSNGNGQSTTFKSGQPFVELGETNGFLRVVKDDGNVWFIPKAANALSPTKSVDTTTLGLTTSGGDNIADRSKSFASTLKGKLANGGHIVIQASVPKGATGEKHDEAFSSSLDLALAFKDAGVDTKQISFAPPTAGANLTVGAVALSGTSK